jgi:regulator of sigma D
MSPRKEQGMAGTPSAVIEERRSQSGDLVAKLVAERTEMLATFCRLAGIEPYLPDRPVQRLLQEFCQILVDYVAAGHFALYERIVEGKERRQEVANAAAEFYPRIAETTDTALDFNDKYDCEDHCTALESLAEDLSRLGEELAVRIELEDKLLAAMVRR